MAKSIEQPLSVSVGDYLKAAWAVANSKPATTSALAEHLGISPASVSAMLGKLQDMGLVEYERYRGVRLTARGEREVMRLLRRHRLLETFMIEHLQYTWDEVHDEAEAIEHVISDRFTERLAELLNQPSHDPHGDPIPTADGSLPATPNTPLADVPVGAALTISRLMSQDADVLSYLAELGIQPGKKMRVTKREPVGGLIHVELEDRQAVLSKEMAMLIRGEELS